LRLVVFTINTAAGSLNAGGDVFGMANIIKYIFLDINISMVIFTCILDPLITHIWGCRHSKINSAFAPPCYVMRWAEFFLNWPYKDLPSTTAAAGLMKNNDGPARCSPSRSCR